MAISFVLHLLVGLTRTQVSAARVRPGGLPASRAWAAAWPRLPPRQAVSHSSAAVPEPRSLLRAGGSSRSGRVQMGHFV